MAQRPPSTLYQTIVETQGAVDFGRLEGALSGSDRTEMVNRALSITAVWTPTLTRLGQEIRRRQERCRQEPCSRDLVSKLGAVKRIAETTADAVRSLNWVFAAIKKGDVPLGDELDLINRTMREVRRACDDLATGLARLKPLVAPAQAARRRRPGIRADIERDAG